MEYLVIYPEKPHGTWVSTAVSKDEAIELIRNILDDGSVALDQISVYEAKRLEISLGLVE